MTILQSLTGLYDRLDRRGQYDGRPYVPPPGLKPVAIDYILELDPGGRVIDLKSRIPADKKRGGKLMVPGTAYNPKPGKGEPAWDDLSFRGRTSGRRSFLFWDKSSYVFGVAAKKGEVQPDFSDKAKLDHAAFVAAHREVLAGTTDPHLLALLQFLDDWRPEQWDAHKFPAAALDKNIVFEVAGARMRLDQLSEARERAKRVVAVNTPLRQCLVTGERAPYAAGHPIFQVRGAQSSGAAMVSFNADAFLSYGLDKAEASPVSEGAAFKYGAALTWLLDRVNARSFQLGETTVVYWADDKPGAEEAEAFVGATFADAAAPAAADDEVEDDEDANANAADDDADGADDDDAPPPPDIDEVNVSRMREQATNAEFQRAVPDAAKLDPSVRLHVLGLSPNAGRIAVRFWLVETWGDISKNIARFKDDLSIEPPPHNPDKKAYALLYEVAVLGKRENIPPRLGGELARAILTGGPYPQTLLSGVVARIRADKQVNAERTSLCKAIINRNYGKEIVPVSLDSESKNPAYSLGRLFAVYEYAEKAVADRNATIKDKFIGAASATPRRVFPILMRGYEHNASALAKQDGNKRGAGIRAAKALGQILELFDNEMPFPTALRLEDQGRFFVGYYHQTRALYTKSDSAAASPATDPEGTEE